MPNALSWNSTFLYLVLPKSLRPRLPGATGPIHSFEIKLHINHLGKNPNPKRKHSARARARPEPEAGGFPSVLVWAGFWKSHRSSACEFHVPIFYAVVAVGCEFRRDSSINVNPSDLVYTILNLTLGHPIFGVAHKRHTLSVVLSIRFTSLLPRSPSRPLPFRSEPFRSSHIHIHNVELSSLERKCRITKEQTHPSKNRCRHDRSHSDIGAHSPSA